MTTTAAHTSTLTAVVCSECGKGTFRLHGRYVAACRVCNAEIAPSDIIPNLRAHEYLTVDDKFGDIVCIRSFS